MVPSRGNNFVNAWLDRSFGRANFTFIARYLASESRVTEGLQGYRGHRGLGEDKEDMEELAEITETPGLNRKK